MNIEQELARVVGDGHVLTDPGLTTSYAVDWTGRFAGTCRAVVRPADTAQVSAVLAACSAVGVAVVPQGGNTGLVGGSVPHDAAHVVLSLRRLSSVGAVDVTTRSLTAGAGATVAAVQAGARAAGLRYGVDLASRDSATVGGTVATNAGGLRVVRHGTTRPQVLGLEYVLADGHVVDRLESAPQDNAGLDLTGLLVGSEGTLAVVTAARLRLVAPDTGPGYVVLVGCPDVAGALDLLATASPAGVRAAEVMFDRGVALVRDVAGLPAPLAADHPVFLLLETDELPDLPEDIDAAVDPALWAYRERHTEAIATQGVVHKLDVSLPLSRVAEFAAELAEATAPYDTYVFGHLAMGNLHVNVVGGSHDVDARVLRLVASLGGSIAAEHGIGFAKAEFLPLVRSDAEIALMRRVKSAFDPAALLNPGVLFR